MNPPDAAAVLAAHDAILARVAARLHDHPVQHLVAAALLLESATADAGGAVAGEPLVARAVEAVRRAATTCRAVLGAVEPARVADVADVRAELAVLASEAVVPSEGTVRTKVAVSEDTPAAALEVAVRCAHDAAGDVLAAGRALAAVTVAETTASDAGGGDGTLDRVLVVRLVVDGAGPAPVDGPGVALASQRAALAGGQRVAAAANEVRFDIPC